MSIKRFFKIILNIVFYFVIVTLLLLSFSVVISNIKGQQPEILGYKFYSVLSGSMDPTIETGDLIMVKDISPEDIEVGDVITYESSANNKITTHRVTNIVQEDKIKFKTKGDANNVEDTNLVEAENIKGKYVRKFHGLGYAVTYIEQNIIKILITLVILSICLFVIAKVVKEIIKNKK